MERQINLLTNQFLGVHHISHFILDIITPSDDVIPSNSIVKIDNKLVEMEEETIVYEKN